MNIDVAYRLAQLRRDRGFSQETLAGQLGVSRQAVSKWERAESSPDTDNLIALAELYGLTLDELLKGGPEVAEAEVEPAAGERGPQPAVGESAAPGSAAPGSTTTGPTTGDAGVTDASTSSVDTAGAGAASSATSSTDAGTDASPEDSPKEKSAPKEYVHIGPDGIHVMDKGGEEVHIGPVGIHLYEPSTGDRIDSPAGVFVGVRYDSGKEAREATANHDQHGKSPRWAYVFPWPLLVVVAYALIGSFSGAWGKGLLLFLLIPLFYTALDAVVAKTAHRRRSSLEGLFVLLIVTVFFALGLLGGLWHPGWIVLLAIPVVLGVWEAFSPKSKLSSEPRA